MNPFFDFRLLFVPLGFPLCFVHYFHYKHRFNCSNWVVSNKLTNRDCIEYKSPFVCLYYGIHRSGTPPCGQRMERQTQCMRVISRDWFPVRSKVLSLFDCSNEGRDGPVALPATKITLSSFFMPHYESNIRTHEFKKQ